MEESCCSYKTKKALQAHHSAAEQEALRMFNETNKLVEGKLAEKYREYLYKKLQQNFRLFEMDNYCKEMKMITTIRDRMMETEKSYASCVEKFLCGDFSATKALASAKTEKHKVKTKFLSRCKDYDDGILEPYKREMDDRLEKSFQSFERDVSWKVRDVEATLSGLSEKAKKEYEKCMDDVCKENAVDQFTFNDAHKRAEEKALSLFDMQKVKNVDNKKEEYRDLLQKAINKRKENLKESNASQLEFQKKCIHDTMSKAKNKYDECLREGGKKWLNPGLVRDQDHIGREEAERYINSLNSSKGADYVKKCKAELSDYLENALTTFKQENQSFREISKVDLQKIVQTLRTSYLSAMEKNLDEKRFVNEKELEKLHDRKKQITLHTFVKGEADAEEDYIKSEKELELAIEIAYEEILDENNQKKKKCESEFDVDAADLLKDYSNKMRKVCKRKYQEPEQLEDIHNNTKQSVILGLQDKWRGLYDINTENSKLLKLRNSLDSEYENIKMENEENKGFFKTIKEGVVKFGKGFVKIFK